jgi:hypothetical protein
MPNPVSCNRPATPQRPAAAKPKGAGPKPAPRPQGPTLRPDSFANRPIFGLSQEIAGHVAKPQHPLETPAGLVVLPVAVAVDVVDVVTRPLQALFGVITGR